MNSTRGRIESLEVLLHHLLLLLVLRCLLLVVIHFLINLNFINTLAAALSLTLL